MGPSTDRTVTRGCTLARSGVAQRLVARTHVSSVLPLFGSHYTVGPVARTSCRTSSSSIPLSPTRLDDDGRHLPGAVRRPFPKSYLGSENAVLDRRNRAFR